MPDYAWRKPTDTTGLTRRVFLAAGTAAALTLGQSQASAEEASGAKAKAESGAASPSLIDVNVSLSHWPLRRVPLDETPKLVAKLRANGVESAWAGSFDGLLHKDIGAVNARLAEECKERGEGILVPFGSVNPTLPDWEEDLRRCAEVHKMPGVRLHPNYHGYKLDDPAFARLLALAAERRLIVQIALHMEDERMMHRLMRVEPVETAPLAEAMKAAPGSRVVLLNAMNVLVGEKLTRAIAAGEVYVEIATIEGVGGIERLLTQSPLARVLFGSHAPLFYFESAKLKLKESALSEEQLRAISGENARRLLGAA